MASRPSEDAGRSEESPDELFANENSVAVVMTHNYGRDREILRRLLSSKCLYVGALGPKKRTEKVLAQIAGENFAGAQTANLRTPSYSRLKCGTSS